MDEGEVLWIDAGICDVPELPGGFPFLVVDVFGWAEPWQVVWVRGMQLDERTGIPMRERTLPVPINQRRAVERGRAAPIADGDAVAVGPPEGYRRRDVR
jgi:hypothetical protein